VDVFRPGLALCLLAATGCPEPEPDLTGCPAAGVEPSIVARPNRLDTSPLADGSSVPVFPPPQGGVFTELDIELAGIAAEDLEELRVEVLDPANSEIIAAQLYFGDGLPLTCNDDGVLVVRNLPVGFNDSTDLAELDQVGVMLSLRVVTAEETLAESWSVVLVVTD
jgi:hypothetical protein